MGKAAGKSVMTLETGLRGLPQISVAAQVSVMVPPQFPDGVVKVDKPDVPLIRQEPVDPLLYGSLLAAGILSQSTVILAGGTITGKSAGFTFMVRVSVAVLPQPSVDTKVTVTVPPHTPAVPETEAVTVTLATQLSVALTVEAHSVISLISSQSNDGMVPM